MQPYQQRVIEEQEELGKKLLALKDFIKTEAFSYLPEDEQRRMRVQRTYMTLYYNVLGERIAAFE